MHLTARAKEQDSGDEWMNEKQKCLQLELASAWAHTHTQNVLWVGRIWSTLALSQWIWWGESPIFQECLFGSHTPFSHYQIGSYKPRPKWALCPCRMVEEHCSLLYLLPTHDNWWSLVTWILSNRAMFDSIPLHPSLQLSVPSQWCSGGSLDSKNGGGAKREQEGSKNYHSCKKKCHSEEVL